MEWECYFTKAMNSDLKREQSHHPREFDDFTFTYPVLSRRSRGVSIGVNLNLDKHCNFDCPYCQVDRTLPKAKQEIQINEIQKELERFLSLCDQKGVFQLPRFKHIPDADKRLRDIALSGDGEPTMAPEFRAVCKMLAALQSSRPELDFNLVLITNSTLLNKPRVREGIGFLLSIKGEVWAKLDAGTEDWYQKVNVARISLDRIESNLIELGKVHPFKIQSLFCGVDGQLPPSAEIEAYLQRLQRIKSAGSLISEVQLHTLARPPAQSSCISVPGELLFSIKEKIETGLGIAAKVYGQED